MAYSLAEVDFNAQCSANKLIVSDVSECKCCLYLKQELKEMQEELSSTKLIIKLLQTEGDTHNNLNPGDTWSTTKLHN